MAVAFESVSLDQLKAHVRIYAFQALGILAVLIYGYALDVNGKQLFVLAAVVAAATFVAGVTVSKLKPIQQAMIAKEAMLVTFPPIFNALFLIVIIAVYALNRPLGIVLWLLLLAFEGTGFARSIKDWHSYLTKVNANAR